MEESLPSMLASMCGWFTPTVLFVLLNLVIGGIAVASKSSHHHQPGAAADDDGGAYPGRFLARSPSIVLDRLRSFNLHRCLSGEIPPPFEASDHRPEHSGLSQSEPRPTAGEMPPRLSVPIKKPASEESAFPHFHEAEVDEAAAAAAATETVDPAEGDGDEEVDARADDFINRFRHQLKLQRMASIMRYRAMPNRGR
ncbi:unnamed protein product [Musa acuminata subsp. malaccensis]|uniref:(wild Malaysian banana) hypothetical protein n=1 Tax=Musa acuminata subsp. malaccensis TaxID=214687 RepID=A0A804KR04_MUSAM|nr:PREDICTED: uncharacterized protein LOC103973081 [Musa acuminata subsp. malaccensis]CAG1852085.1 unnamed protein product [Musa acuminata subsp. malaccensis]